MRRCNISKTDYVRLRHILDAAKEAVDFSKVRLRKDLDNDRMLALALVRLLEIIGEAARGLSSELLTAYPAIPWKKTIGG